MSKAKDKSVEGDGLDSVSTEVLCNNGKKRTLGERLGAETAAKEAEKRAINRMMKGIPLSVVESGCEPLKDLRRERFCQGYVAGADSLELYWKLWRDELGVPRNKKSTAMGARSRLMKSPEVKNRIAFLQRQNAQVARVDREEKLRITEEIIQGLRADFRNGDRGKTVSDLMSALARHDAMTGEADKPTLKIELGLGGLLSGIDKVVETRLGLTTKPEKKAEGGEVVE